MGMVSFARWTNAPTTALDWIGQSIVRNHQGVKRGRWHLSIKTYRSTLGSVPGFQVASERSIAALTMNDKTYLLLEDPAAPQHYEVADPIGPGAPTHYRSMFLAVSPPSALDELLGQLRARWVPTRQSTAPGTTQRSSGPQMSVEGYVYAIGTDFLVRVGNVILAGGAVKGLLMEAEYLPLPASSSVCNGNLVLLSNILGSLLPNAEATDWFELPKTFGITITTEFWNDVVWNREEAEEAALNKKPSPGKKQEEPQEAPKPTDDQPMPVDEVPKPIDDPMTGVNEEIQQPAAEKEDAVTDVKMAEEGTAPEVKAVAVEETPLEDEDIFVSGSELMAPLAKDDEIEAALRSAAQILLGLRHDGLF